MKPGDLILAILLTSSILAVLFISQNSPPVQRRPFICRQGLNQTSIECNALGSCSSEYTCSIKALLIGLMSLSFLLILVCKTEYGLRLFGVALTGFFITAALSIQLSNNFSADVQSSPFCSFIVPCNPNPPLQELCAQALKERANFVTFNCTTTHDEWDIPAGSSSFPCILPLFAYSITAVSFGEWMIQRKITGSRGDLWLILAFVGFGLFGSATTFYNGLFVTALDIIVCYTFGGIMSWFFLVNVMNLVYPYPDLPPRAPKRARG